MKTWQKVLLGAGAVGAAVFALWRLWPEEQYDVVIPQEFGYGNGYGNGYGSDPNFGVAPSGHTPVPGGGSFPLAGGMPQSVIASSPRTSFRSNTGPGCPPNWAINPATGACIPVV